MKKRINAGLILIYSFTIFIQLPANAQFTIDSCLKLAIANYPLIRQNELIRQQGKNNEKMLNEAWLSQLSVNSRATYQSEVANFDFPGFPSIVFPKDQYHLGLQLNQVLFDGGLTQALKQADRVSTEIEVQKMKCSFIRLKSVWPKSMVIYCLHMKI